MIPCMYAVSYNWYIFYIYFENQGKKRIFHVSSLYWSDTPGRIASLTGLCFVFRMDNPSVLCILGDKRS